MIFVQIFIPHSKKSAKWALIISLIVYLIGWAIIGSVYLNEKEKQNSWGKAEATITEYDRTDPSRPWTIYIYEVDGKEYTGKHYGIGLKDKIGDTRNIFYDIKEPTKSIYEEEITDWADSKSFTEVWLVFSAFPILYIICFIYQAVKEKKQN